MEKSYFKPWISIKAAQLITQVTLFHTSIQPSIEFISALTSHILSSDTKYLKKTFTEFDENGDGKIDSQELAKVLNGDGSH